MKKLIVIFLLFGFVCKAQDPRIADAKHYYAGVGVNLLSYGFLSMVIKRKPTIDHNYFREKRIPLKMTISTGVGFFAGWAKENIWDGYMHRGVKNPWDCFTTCYGSVCCTMGVGCGEIVKRDKAESLEKFMHLNDTLKIN